MLARKRLEQWTALFLTSTVATSVTGFGFPFDHLLPSHVVGIISLLVLTAAIVARYALHLNGAWGRLYVITAMVVCLAQAKSPGVAADFLREALGRTPDSPGLHLMLSHLLATSGIDSVVVDHRSRAEIEHTHRAGILEQDSVRLLTESGVSDRVHRDGWVLGDEHRRLGIGVGRTDLLQSRDTDPALDGLAVPFVRAKLDGSRWIVDD